MVSHYSSVTPNYPVALLSTCVVFSSHWAEKKLMTEPACMTKKNQEVPVYIVWSHIYMKKLRLTASQP